MSAEPAALALGHAARAHRLDQIIDGPCRDAVQAGLLDDGNEGLSAVRRGSRKLGK
jgi:hypothetical protein